MSTKEELLKRLSEGVLEMEEDDVAEAAQEYIDAGYPALDAINQGLIDGMNQASELFEEEEYFCNRSASLLGCHVCKGN